jgi:hypothetical protein
MPATIDRLVLQGVPRLHFYEGGPGCPEDIPFPSAMRALTEFLGDDELGCRTCRGLTPGCKVACSYAHFIGVSGVAAYLNWKPGWEMDNVEIMYMSDDPAAPFSRGFDAAGRHHRYLGHEEGVGRDEMRAQIVDSIRRGVPVLAFGPIGPPETALVCGYDDAGDVLIGWSFFQGMPPFNAGVELEPSGMFRVRGWFDYEPGFSCIVVGEKVTRPTLAETYRAALPWLLRVARTPSTFGGRANGLAAYGVWMQHLQRDEDFPQDEAVLRGRHDVHNNLVGFLAEARWYGSLFLAQAANGESLPFRATSHLLHAAACWAEIHALMWKVWDLAGGNGNPDAWRLFARPEVRRSMLPVLEEARRQDTEATEHIEKALASL